MPTSDPHVETRSLDHHSGYLFSALPHIVLVLGTYRIRCSVFVDEAIRFTSVGSHGVLFCSIFKGAAGGDNVVEPSLRQLIGQLFRVSRKCTLGVLTLIQLTVLVST